MTLPLIVGISGASGAICGVQMLQTLRKAKVPTHLTPATPSLPKTASEKRHSGVSIGGVAGIGIKPCCDPQMYRCRTGLVDRRLNAINIRSWQMVDEWRV